MAWDEWDRLKSEARDGGPGGPTGTRLNRLEPGAGPATPSTTGDLNVNQPDLAKIGSHAHTLYNQLWDQARLDNTSVDGAASDLSTQGFALGPALQHVSNRWSRQLGTVLDACAHIANHMQVTKKIHNGDEDYIRRQMSSIDVLDAGFDERVGPAGARNAIYGEKKK
ncbi:hypothetical protein [Streptomyces sp. bgisy022]|uniref:hypothetical protein n=1 Tax=Streptomyces sp. bgisy022 TaxID=3413769 RepID=UPI003D728E5F